MPAEPDRTVLIVDDQPDVRDSLAMLLGLHGFPTATAAGGRAALEYLRGHPPPSLIVLDLRMPQMSGVQFLQELRREPDLAGIPVIVCSAEFEPQDVEALQGVRAFYRKSDDPEALVRVVEEHCPGK